MYHKARSKSTVQPSSRVARTWKVEAAAVAGRGIRGGAVRGEKGKRGKGRGEGDGKPLLKCSKWP